MLVGVEVMAQAPVVLLDDDPGLILCGLGVHAAHRITIDNEIVAQNNCHFILYTEI